MASSYLHPRMALLVLHDDRQRSRAGLEVGVGATARQCKRSPVALPQLGVAGIVHKVDQSSAYDRDSPLALQACQRRRRAVAGFVRQHPVLVRAQPPEVHNQTYKSHEVCDNDDDREAEGKFLSKVTKHWQSTQSERCIGGRGTTTTLLLISYDGQAAVFEGLRTLAVVVVLGRSGIHGKAHQIRLCAFVACVRLHSSSSSCSDAQGDVFGVGYHSATSAAAVYTYYCCVSPETYIYRYYFPRLFFCIPTILSVNIWVEIRLIRVSIDPYINGQSEISYVCSYFCRNYCCTAVLPYHTRTWYCSSSIRATIFPSTYVRAVFFLFSSDFS